MPHVYALPTQQRDALAQEVAPPITIRVLMTATYRDVVSFTGGVPTFANTYTRFQSDLTTRLSGSLKVDTSRPIFPDGDPFERSELQIPIINTDGYIAALQSGAMIRLADIDQGVIEIQAVIAGVTQPVTVFKGRIIGPPTEELGLSTFTIVDTIWDAIRQPALYEDFGNIAGTQAIAVVNGLLNASHRTVNTLAGGHFCVYNGVVRFDSRGDTALRYENSDSTAGDLTSITVKNRAKLGLYTITFRDSTNYTILYPDNSVYNGSINADAITPFIDLLQSSWTSTAYTAGQKITFHVGAAYKGNPITIARNFIEKALLNNWGIAPAQTMQVKMDTAAWNAAENRFHSYTIFLSETNENNSVWEQKRGGGNMPMNCLQLAQKALDHVGCFLQMRQDGLISITTPFFDGRQIWDLTGDNAILSGGLKIQGGPQWNFLTLQYGEDKGSFAATATHDLRVSPTDEVNEQVVSAPYLKAGASRFRASWLMETYVRRYHTRQQIISIQTTPQMGLPMLCGDVVRVVSDRQPAISLICEIIRASIEIGGPCSFDLVPIQQYEGAPFRLCVAQLDRERLW